MNITWISLNDREPPEGDLVMVTGPSGNVINRKFLTLAYFDELYRPRLNNKPRWLDVTNTALSDHGFMPTHWAELVELP